MKNKRVWCFAGIAKHTTPGENWPKINMHVSKVINRWWGRRHFETAECAYWKAFLSEICSELNSCPHWEALCLYCGTTYQYILHLWSIPGNMAVSLSIVVISIMWSTGQRSFRFQIANRYSRVRKIYAFHQDITLGSIRKFVSWIRHTEWYRCFRLLKVLVWFLLGQMYIWAHVNSFFKDFNTVCNLLVIHSSEF